eukprot:365436-Chlamydomonas_euryale.AAC.10
MCHSAPELLDALLSHLADQMAEYIKYQIDSGAQCVQIFDSWGGQLPPREWDTWSGPYLRRMVAAVKASHPTVPLTLYANGSGGLLERIKSTGVDVVGLDWTVDMADARARLGNDVSLQGNVDPVVLFAEHSAIEAAVRDTLEKAGKGRHVLNLGHGSRREAVGKCGVMRGTPEDVVAHTCTSCQRSCTERQQLREAVGQSFVLVTSCCQRQSHSDSDSLTHELLRTVTTCATVAQERSAVH